MRYAQPENLSILGLDKNEFKITLKSKDLTNSYNIQILDSSLFQALNTYFLDTWEKAKTI